MLKTVLLDYNPIVHVTSKLLNGAPILADAADYIRSLIFEKDDLVLEKLLFLLGVTTITLKSACFLGKFMKRWSWIPKHILDQKKVTSSNLKERYGDCFVLITGFTQGIGRGYAEIFAELGFNLLLVGRNPENVDKKVKELKNIYKNIRIESFAVDLNKPKEIDQLEDHFKMFKDLDIGIVVNNAGSVVSGPYHTLDPQELIDDVNCDLMAVFTINRILIPRLRARDHRSAILNLSSCTGYYLTARLGVYSSAKLIYDVYSRVLSMENEDKIDIMSLRPFGVTTKMMKMKRGPFMVSPRSFAQQSLG